MELTDRDAVRIELLGIGEDSDLPLASAGHAHFADAVDSFQHALDLLIGNLGRFAKASVAGHGYRNDCVGIGIGFLNDRRKNVRRKISKRAGDFLTNVLGGAFNFAFK